MLKSDPGIDYSFQDSIRADMVGNTKLKSSNLLQFISYNLLQCENEYSFFITNLTLLTYGTGVIDTVPSSVPSMIDTLSGLYRNKDSLNTSLTCSKETLDLTWHEITDTETIRKY